MIKNVAHGVDSTETTYDSHGSTRDSGIVSFCFTPMVICFCFEVAVSIVTYLTFTLSF